MDLDDLLTATAPVTDPSPQTLAAGRAALSSAVTSRRPRRVRRLGLVAAVAAAATVAVVVGPTVDLGDRRPSANAEAAQLLLRAGAAAGAQPGGWPDAAYWHSVSTYDRGGTEYRREIWIGHRADGVLKDPGVDGGLVPLGVAVFPAGGRGLTWDELYALPTEAGKLERELRSGIDGAGPDDDTELFVIVGDLLRESPAPPALRKALWEVAARVPGVRVVGAVVDHAGRPGMAVERGGQRYVLDPDDGRLLEESSGGAWRSTYLEQGPADSAPAPTWTNRKEAELVPAG